MMMSPTRDASVASMDIDDAGVAPKPDTVFARSREMTVALYSHLPEEVRLALRNAGVYHGCASTNEWRMIVLQ